MKAILRSIFKKLLLSELDQMYHPLDPYMTSAKMQTKIAELFGTMSFSGPDDREKHIWKVRNDLERSHRFSNPTKF